ncbi:lachesin-like [Mercenaria mercenaria]|uniref:lachesin-like n=1 Tax=Mercenaria mercenaria TaxID=6596 RepID=UPI00234F06D8|nr:lachesin-like [Mercenaria mercenaria]
MLKFYWIDAAVVTLLLGTVWCQQDPEIVDEIIPEVTSQGGQAKLNCTVVNKQDGHTVIWTFLDSKSGGEIITSDENIFVENKVCKEGSKKYEIVKREFNKRITYMLVINCLEVVDYGYYKCYIQIRGDGSASWPSKIGHLIVQVPPTITSKNVAVLQLDVGHSHNLECTATGVPKPNITWVRSDGGLLPGIDGAQLRNTILPLKNVTKEDRGLYKCIADNQVRPPDLYLVSLSVFFKPETMAVQDTVGQAQNRQFDAKLECRVSGYPEPEVVWYKEPTRSEGNTQLMQLNDDEKYEITKLIATTTLRFQEAWYVLRIKNVEANDYTKYFCVARNRIGENRQTIIELFETMECQGANCPSFEAQGASAISVSMLATVAMVTLAKLIL